MLEKIIIEFNLNYAHEDGEKELKVKPGELLFLLGANGTGKSALIHKFTTQNAGKVLRVTAHRQTWINSDSLELTNASRRGLGNDISIFDQRDHSRYKDNYGSNKSQLIIFDLINAENINDRKIARAMKNGDKDQINTLTEVQSPLDKLNYILHISNLNFQVEVDDDNNLVAVKDSYQPYGISQLSDGERSALLIICSVLTAPKDTLILLDEPERHLHRSIVSPLISTLLSYREDCAFVVSTHDITLPCDQKDSDVLLLRKYTDTQRTWVVDHIKNLDQMDEEVSIAILGARRILLFVEGNSSSLDIQIYQILYPSVTVKAVGSCLDVERIVRGIRATESDHRISAWGIIDRDNRSDDECKEFHKIGIIPLEQYSVESLYYHPSVTKDVLNRVASIQVIDINSTMSEIEKAVLEQVKKHHERLAALLVERKVKDIAVRKCPNWQEIIKGSVEVSFSTEKILEEEKKHISSLLEKGDVGKLIARYPVRETGVLILIAKKLLFKNKKAYELAVIKMLIDCEESLNMVLTLIAPVTECLKVGGRSIV